MNLLKHCFGLMITLANSIISKDCSQVVIAMIFKYSHMTLAVYIFQQIFTLILAVVALSTVSIMSEK